MSNTNKKFVIYTDGGSRGNPGPAGAGAVIFDENNKVLKEVKKFLGNRTNNYAEYEAIIIGFQALKKLVHTKDRKQAEIEVCMDSELIQQQLTNKYQIKEESLFGQFIKAHNILVKDFHNVTFTHVRREDNAHADRLANEAMDSG